MTDSVHKFGPLPGTGNPLVIAGPCSAESRSSVVTTARALADAGVTVFRAGLWKPRTMPGGFEGVGDRGLPWLAEVRDTTGMAVATEVAKPEHVAAVIDAGIDMVWIGARTTTNPFAVQEIADTIARLKPELPVLVKNPVNPDINLWIGGIERLYRAGVTHLGAVHRGFTSYEPSSYRNTPHWQMPLELRRRLPGLPVIHDPSHIGGKRDLIEPLIRTAMALGLDGLIVECHINPDEALSDAAQQLTPAGLADILARIEQRHVNPDGSTDDLTLLRSQLDDIDARVIDLLARRMRLSREIGRYKEQRRMTVLQPKRYEQLISSRLEQGEAAGLERSFISDIMQRIHAESVRLQTDTDTNK